MINIEWLKRVAKEAAEMAGPNDTEFRLVVNGEKLDATYEVVEGQKSFAEVLLHYLANRIYS